MKGHLTSSRTEARGKLETSKASPNTGRLAQHTAWNFGNVDTQGTGVLCHFFFNSMAFHTTSVANGEKIVSDLDFFYSKNEGKVSKKCVELLMLRTTYYRLRELKGVYRSLLSCVRCIGERKQLMIMFIM